jgi:hypothetical protein
VCECLSPAVRVCAGEYDNAWVELGALQETLEDKCADKSPEDKSEETEDLRVMVERARLCCTLQGL